MGIFTSNEFLINDHIATSLTHFTLNSPRFINKPVYEFVRYTITQDDNVTLSFQVLNAVSYAPLTQKFSINCKLNTAVKIYD